MSAKGFENELSRALARPDIEMLRRVVSVYHDWSVNKHPDDYYPDEVDTWMNASKDEDLALALIILAAATYDDPEFLATVAAGLLENIISHEPAWRKIQASDELIDRILEESRRTPRFRWMLSGVWFGQEMNPAHIEAIEKATANCHMDRGEPLPPRPWA